MVKEPRKPVNAADFEICDDSPDVTRRVFKSQYTEWFEKLPVGKALKMKPGDVARISCALHKWAKVNRPDCRVKNTKNYPGDKSEKRGRVWLLLKDGA